ARNARSSDSMRRTRFRSAYLKAGTPSCRFQARAACLGFSGKCFSAIKSPRLAFGFQQSAFSGRLSAVCFSAVTFHRSAFSDQLAAVGFQRAGFSGQLFSGRLSAVSFQRSAFSGQLSADSFSAVGFQRSAFSVWLSTRNLLAIIKTGPVL